jgi:hypothetical protein
MDEMGIGVLAISVSLAELDPVQIGQSGGSFSTSPQWS